MERIAPSGSPKKMGDQNQSKRRDKADDANRRQG
jgi:hypothetical protein